MQPESFGSAFGLFVALLQILERDPGASVVLLPSTHQVQDEEILTPWIHRAATLAALRPQRLFVLGIEREAGITASAYIVTGRYDNRGGFEIARLFEAPPSVVPTAKPHRASCAVEFRHRRGSGNSLPPTLQAPSARPHRARAGDCARRRTRPRVFE